VDNKLMMDGELATLLKGVTTERCYREGPSESGFDATARTLASGDRLKVLSIVRAFGPDKEIYARRISRTASKPWRVRTLSGTSAESGLIELYGLWDGHAFVEGKQFREAFAYGIAGSKPEKGVRLSWVAVPAPDGGPELVRWLDLIH